MVNRFALVFVLCVGMMSSGYSQSSKSSETTKVSASITQQQEPEYPKLEGKEFCHNYNDEEKGVKKNCACSRACGEDGKPQRDYQCVNDCKEDPMCKCHTKCGS